MVAARVALRRISTLVLAATLASCLLDSNEPQFRPLRFQLLAMPSHVAVGDSTVVDLVFSKPSVCWQLHSITATVQGDVIEIKGEAVNRDPDSACIDVRRSHAASLKLPRLAKGRYVVRAGALVDTLDVGGITGLPGRIVFTATVHTLGQGCGTYTFPGDFDIALSGLPPDLAPHYYLVRGSLSSEDPCGLQATWDRPFDYFVRVREVTLR